MRTEAGPDNVIASRTRPQTSSDVACLPCHHPVVRSVDEVAYGSAQGHGFQFLFNLVEVSGRADLSDLSLTR
jgi:hypothetical protein